MPTLVVRKRLLVRRDRANGAYTEQLRTALPCMVALSPDGREMVARDSEGAETGHVLRRLRGVVEWRPPIRLTCPHHPLWRVERLVWDPVSGTLAFRGATGGDEAPRVHARGWMDPTAHDAGACTAGIGVLAARTLGWGATPPASSPSIPGTGGARLEAESALRVHWTPGSVLVRLSADDAMSASVIASYDGHAGGVRLCPLYAHSCGTLITALRDMLDDHVLVDMCEGTDRRVGKVVQQNGHRRGVIVRVDWWDGVAHCTCVLLDRTNKEEEAETVGVVLGVDGWAAVQEEKPRRIAAPPVNIPSTFTDVHTDTRFRAAGVARVRGYPIYILHTADGRVRLVAAHELVSSYRNEGRMWEEKISTSEQTVDRMLRASGAYPMHQPARRLPIAERLAQTAGTIRLARGGSMSFRVRGVRGRAYWRSAYTLSSDQVSDRRRAWEASRILPYVQKKKNPRSTWTRADVRADVRVVVYPRDSVTDRMLTLFHQLKTQMWDDERVGANMCTDLTRYIDRVMHWTETTGWFAKVALVPGTLLLFDNIACAHLTERAVDWDDLAISLRADGDNNPAKQYVERAFDLLLVTGPPFDAIAIRVFPGRDTMKLSEWARLARRSHAPKRRYIPMLTPPRTLVEVVKRRRRDPPPQRRSRMGIRLDTTAVRRVAVVPSPSVDGEQTPLSDNDALWCVERSTATSPTDALMASVRADVFRRANVHARDGVSLQVDRSGVCRFQRLNARVREALGVDLLTDAFRLDDAAPLVLTLWDGVEDARLSVVRKWGALESIEPRRRLAERVDTTWEMSSTGASERLRRAMARVGVDSCGDISRVVKEELPVTYQLNMDRMLVALARATSVPLRVDDVTRPSRLRGFHTDTGVVHSATSSEEQDMLLVEDGEVTATDRIVDDRRGEESLRGVGYYHLEEDGARRVGFGWCVRDDDGVWSDYAPRSAVRRINTGLEERTMRALWSRWGEVFLYA